MAEKTAKATADTYHKGIDSKGHRISERTDPELTLQNKWRRGEVGKEHQETANLKKDGEQIERIAKHSKQIRIHRPKRAALPPLLSKALRQETRADEQDDAHGEQDSENAAQPVTDISRPPMTGAETGAMPLMAANTAINFASSSPEYISVDMLLLRTMPPAPPKP